jgi:hypothetical protein
MLGHALALASLLLQSPRGVAEPSPSPQPVAIVSAIEGGAWTRPKTGSRKPLTLYDWLEADVVVELAPQARVDLIMIDGRRYALGGGARAKLSSTSLTALQGSVKEEPPVPRLTFLAPIAGKAPDEAGAVRLRARSIAKLNPCWTILTLPDETVLRFEPVEGASQYEIQVRTDTDQQVFSRTIDKPPVAIPTGLLAGGTDYVWTVRVAGRGPSARSEGGFKTLDSTVEAARRALVTGLDPAAIGVLGGIDFHLGLLNEAVAELTAAAERAPGDTAAEGAARRARVALANACQ